MRSFAAPSLSSLSLHAAFMFEEPGEVQNMSRVEWDLGCNLLAGKIGKKETTCFLHGLM